VRAQWKPLMNGKAAARRMRVPNFQSIGVLLVWCEPRGALLGTVGRLWAAPQTMPQKPPERRRRHMIRYMCVCVY
jgi:hypothetical protein